MFERFWCAAFGIRIPNLDKQVGSNMKACWTERSKKTVKFLEKSNKIYVLDFSVHTIVFGRSLGTGSLSLKILSEMIQNFDLHFSLDSGD